MTLAFREVKMKRETKKLKSGKKLGCYHKMLPFTMLQSVQPLFK